MTTLNQKTLLSKTKQDVETFMDEYEMDSCYKTKIMNSIEECFNCCLEISLQFNYFGTIRIYSRPKTNFRRFIRYWI